MGPKWGGNGDQLFSYLAGATGPLSSPGHGSVLGAEIRETEREYVCEIKNHNPVKVAIRMLRNHLNHPHTYFNAAQRERDEREVSEAQAEPDLPDSKSRYLSNRSFQFCVLNLGISSTLVGRRLAFGAGGGGSICPFPEVMYKYLTCQPIRASLGDTCCPGHRSFSVYWWVRVGSNLA